MRIVPPLLTTAAAVALCSLALIALDKTAAPQSASDATFAIPLSDRIERGRYLVHQVGMCIDCHSPRDEGGEFIESQHLTGAPLAFAPTVSMPWMPAAPRIAGLPVGFTEEQTVDFLMTGERPHGRGPVLPPMPPYRMTRGDAEALAAYLRSLPGEN